MFLVGIHNFKNPLPVEKMDINSGIGVDMISGDEGQQYMITISPYTFNDKNKIHSMMAINAGGVKNTRCV